MNKVVLVIGGSCGMEVTIPERFIKEEYEVIINYKKMIKEQIR